jgi:hypothetical protein
MMFYVALHNDGLFSLFKPWNLGRPHSCFHEKSLMFMAGSPNSPAPANILSSPGRTPDQFPEFLASTPSIALILVLKIRSEKKHIM